MSNIKIYKVQLMIIIYNYFKIMLMKNEYKYLKYFRL